MFDTSQLFPFLISGLAFGAVYAMSGTGLLVLYRTTGVLNFAFGAIGAMGANVTWHLIEKTEWCPNWLAYVACVVVATALTLFYGVVLAPRFANRDPLGKMLGTLGFALILLGLMFNIWRSQDARVFRLPTGTRRFEIFDSRVTWTQVVAILFSLAVVFGVTAFLRATKTGTAMRAIANDREIASLLGVPVRSVETVAWLGSGVLCGVVGLLLTDLFGSLDMGTMTFFVIPALAPVLIAQMTRLWVGFFAAFVIGIVEAELNASNWDWPSQYRKTTPYVFAIFAVLWFARKRTVIISGRETR